MAKPPNFPLDTGDAKTPGGRFSANFPLDAYIRFAFKLPFSEKIVQLPKWADADSPFDIEALAPGNPTKDQMRLMMQSLLADRFKLMVHFESREGPVLELTLVRPGQAGSKLRPHAEGPACPETFDMNPPRKASDVFPPVCHYVETIGGPSGQVIGGRDLTLSSIAESIYSFGSLFGEVDRPVVDRTGLRGRYDFTLALPSGMMPSASLAHTPGNPSLEMQGTPFLNAVREQLRLRLVSSHGARRTLVVDHVEEPSKN